MWCHLRESERIFIIYSTELLRDAIPDHTLQSSLCFYTLFPWLWIWLWIWILLFIKLWRGNTYIFLSAQHHFLWRWNSTEWCSYLPLIEVHEATLRPVFFLTLSVYYHYAGCCFAYWNHLCHFFPIFFLDSIVQSFWQAGADVKSKGSVASPLVFATGHGGYTNFIRYC